MKIRFSIKTLMASTLIVAVALGITLLATKDYRQRMAMRSELLGLGADFAHVNPDRSVRLFITHDIESFDFTKCDDIESLELKGMHLDSGSLLKLVGLKHVDVIMLQSCTIEDANALAPLTRISCVDSLLIWSTPIKEDMIETIARVPGIKVVDLSNTQLTQMGINQLRAALPDANIQVRP